MQKAIYHFERSCVARHGMPDRGFEKSLILKKCQLQLHLGRKNTS